MVEQIGPRHQLAKPGRTDVGRSVEHIANKCAGAMMQRLRKPTLKPVNPLRAGNDLGHSATFVEQCGRFECTLPTADDEHLLPGELPKVAVF